MLAGLSPNQLSLANTVIASAIAGLIGIISGPLAQADSTTLALFIAPALAAALFARFTSIAIALVSGLLIGVGQSLMYYVSTLSWFPKSKGGNPLPGVQALLIFLIIVAALWGVGRTCRRVASWSRSGCRRRPEHGAWPGRPRCWPPSVSCCSSCSPSATARRSCCR